MNGSADNNGKLILSIYDFSCNWVQDYINHGYPVICWDKKREGCILERFSWLLHLVHTAQEEYPGLSVYGILAAPPCTDFAGSGAWTWPTKDALNSEYDPFESSTELSIGLVRIVIELVEYFKTTLKFWALENPKGRIEKLVPELKTYRRMTFHPSDFGDMYTKYTILYGEFNENLVKTPVLPLQGSMAWNVGPSKNRQAIRSATPRGFARAFFNANR